MGFYKCYMNELNAAYWCRVEQSFLLERGEITFGMFTTTLCVMGLRVSGSKLLPFKSMIYFCTGTGYPVVIQ